MRYFAIFSGFSQMCNNLMTPLAKTRARRHFTFMRMITTYLAMITIGLAAPFASAQEAPPQDPPVEVLPNDPPAQDEQGEKGEKGEQDDPEVFVIPGLKSPSEVPARALEPGKDLTIRSEEDRAEKLEDLFSSLRLAPDADSAYLVSEEVWAVFLQSGSQSVDFLLLRGIAAENRGDLKLARGMYNHVLRLQPSFAEGWSRSGHLAIAEEDLDRAVNDLTESLIREPRHFFALWTLGNLLEKLGRQDEAFEAYSEALKVYPENVEIKSRVDALKEAVEGKAL